MTRILIVDDSPLSRRVLRGILEGAGHEVLEASDGLAALECYALSQPRVVLLDLMMAGMGGFDVLDQLIQVNPAVRVIIATSDIQDSTRALAHTAGACTLVNKPFQAAQVIQAVNTALAPKS